MDEYLKIFSNWDALSIIAFVLVFKGIDNMKNLTNSIDNLCSVVAKLKIQLDSTQSQVAILQDSLNQTNNRLTVIEAKFDNLEHRFNESEHSFRETLDKILNKINQF